MISKDLFESLPNFEAYFQMIKELFAEGKTTGNNQSDKFIEYTQLSIARTKRGLKTLMPSDMLLIAAERSTRKNWLIITEAWCGDAGNIIPLIVNLAKAIDFVELKFILRDQHPDIMDLFLTNGGRSIPVFVAMDENMNYVTHWGPRPKPAQDMVMDNKRNPRENYEDFQIDLQKWYIQDKGKTLDQELIEYFNK